MTHPDPFFIIPWLFQSLCFSTSANSWCAHTLDLVVTWKYFTATFFSFAHNLFSLKLPHSQLLWNGSFSHANPGALQCSLWQACSSLWSPLTHSGAQNLVWARLGPWALALKVHSFGLMVMFFSVIPPLFAGCWPTISFASAACLGEGVGKAQPSNHPAQKWPASLLLTLNCPVELRGRQENVEAQRYQWALMLSLTSALELFWELNMLTLVKYLAQCLVDSFLNNYLVFQFNKSCLPHCKLMD